MKKVFVCLIGAVLLQLTAMAQFDNLLKRTTNKLKQKVDQKVDEKIDKAVNKTVDGTDDAISNGTKKKSTDKQATGESASTNSGSKSSSFKSYGKYDFIAGEKVVAMEDFSQDAIGDFPDKWNTNASGEVVTLEGQKGKWLKLGKEGVFMPEFINNLPENFTLEFDMACNENFSFYSYGLSVAFAQMTKPAKEFTNWKQHGHDKDGVMVRFHPKDAGGNKGLMRYAIFEAGKETMRNEASSLAFHGKSGNNIVHVSIWRQKQRLRVYVGEEKVWDLPRAFEATKKYNSICFATGGLREEEDEMAIANMRLAVGAPDTRNKLITEGKFVTTGILFDSNSDKIKGESYGVLKEIAAVLNENPDVNVTIVGHTDSDGDDKANMELSKKRAEAVKQKLANDFSISSGRMKTDGKGESQPVAANTSAAGKANNRRVEFIKE
jgi:OmpA-OmpF porin, OOP family